MFAHTKDYTWIDGQPHGRGKLDGGVNESYRLVHDPYKKRITLERYRDEAFVEIVYDSYFLDFRTLSPQSQELWSRLPGGFIADENDRVILREEPFFEGELCVETKTYSAHGILLCRQRVFYTSLGDPENAVVLLDSNGRAVMGKRYSVNADGDFQDLILESWQGEEIEGWQSFQSMMKS